MDTFPFTNWIMKVTQLLDTYQMLTDRWLPPSPNAHSTKQFPTNKTNKIKIQTHKKIMQIKGYYSQVVATTATFLFGTSNKNNLSSLVNAPM